MRVEVDGNTIEYVIDYGKRKKVMIHIDTAGFVRVKAPKGTDKETIEKGVIKNAKAILDKLSMLDSLLAPPEDKKKEYLEGEKFLYLGREYPIRISVDNHAKKCSVEFVNRELSVVANRDDEDVLRDAMQRFYFKELRKIVQKRVANYQKNFNVKPKLLEVEDSSERWGSCNMDRRLTFNWKLIMAPIEVIDYIVVHEMCHMVHMNHDRSFWRLVGSILPKYKDHSDWLAISGSSMSL